MIVCPRQDLALKRGLARVQTGTRARDNRTTKDEDGDEKPTFREQAGRAALV